MSDEEAKKILMDAAEKLKRAGKYFFMAIPEGGKIHGVTNPPPEEVVKYHGVEYIDVKFLGNGDTYRFTLARKTR